MEIIPLPETGHFSLVVASGEALPALFDIVATMALRGPLCVLDGGNVFNAYRLARPLRRMPIPLDQTLKNVRLGRAFTCYQVAALLEQAGDSGMPVLALDFLATFLDEGVPLAERQRVLNGCVICLKRISRHVPLGVWVRAGRDSALLPPLAEAAGRIFQAEALPPLPDLQPSLF